MGINVSVHHSSLFIHIVLHRMESYKGHKHLATYFRQFHKPRAYGHSYAILFFSSKSLDFSPNIYFKKPEQNQSYTFIISRQTRKPFPTKWKGKPKLNHNHSYDLTLYYYDDIPNLRPHNHLTTSTRNHPQKTSTNPSPSTNSFKRPLH